MGWPELRLALARTMSSRLRGLLGQPSLASDEGLCLMPCAAVHTFGMRYAIDVVFLDDGGHVEKCVMHLAPSRVAVCWGATYAVELAAGFCQQHPDYADRIRHALRAALARHGQWDDWRQIPGRKRGKSCNTRQRRRPD